MDIFLNGEPVRLESELLTDVLAALGFADRQVAVAVNEAFVAKAQWPDYRMQAGDRIDVLSPIEGG